MTEPLRQIAVVADELDVLAAFRARVDALNVSRCEIDRVAGLPSGYAAKMLCDPPMRYIGPKSMWNLAAALGLTFVLVEDPAATARFAARMDKRETRNVRVRAIVRSGRVPWLFTPEKGREMAKMAMGNMSKDQISRQRTKAARSRWKAVRAQRSTAGAG